MFGGTMKLAMVFSAIDRLSGPVLGMVRSVVKLEKLKAAGESIRKFGDGTVAAGAAVDYMGQRAKAGIAAVLQPMMEQEDAAAALSTVITPTMGTVEEATERARKAARAWSDQHSQSTAEYLNATYQMASAGLAEEQALAGTQAALTLARGAMGDNVAAANLLAVVYNTMGNKTADVSGEMTYLSDVLGKTQQLFQIKDLQQLSEGLKYGIPAAQGARVSIEQLSTVVGQLNSSGLQGSMAGTALAVAMTKMQKAGRDLGFEIKKTSSGGMDLIGTLQSMTDKYGPLSAAKDRWEKKYDSKGNYRYELARPTEKFQEVFGDEGVRAVGLLMENMGALQAAYKGVQNSTGAAETAAARMEDTTSSAMAILKNQVMNVAADIGQELVPVLSDLRPTIVGAVEAVKSWIQTNPGLAQFAAHLLSIGAAAGMVLGPILMVTGVMVSGFGRAIGAAVTLIRVWRWLRTGEMKDFSKDAQEILPHIRKMGTALWDMAKRAVAAGVAFMSTPAGWLTAALLGLAAAIAYVALKWEDLTGQTNRFVKVAPDMMGRLKGDAKFKQQMVNEAMSGNKAKQAILQSVFKGEFDQPLWDRVNFMRKQQQQDGFLAKYGLGGPETPELVRTATPPTGTGAAIDRSVRIDRIEINNTEPMDEDAVARLMGQRVSEAMDAMGMP